MCNVYLKCAEKRTAECERNWELKRKGEMDLRPKIVFGACEGDAQIWAAPLTHTYKYSHNFVFRGVNKNEWKQVYTF